METSALSLLLVLAFAGTVDSLQAQPYIQSLSRDGALVATNLAPGSGAAVEWAPTATGPWSETWKGLQDAVADPNGTIQVAVPMFYRVRASNPNPSGLAWIPPGTFLMGAPTNEAGHALLQHEVTISHGFWMGKHELTQGEYLEVVGTNPSYWRNGKPPEAGPGIVGTALANGVPGTGGRVTNDVALPVDTVSWFDATNYCGLLTERERLAGRLPQGYEYRLPTEAEWEYACRAGTTTALYLGGALLSGMANFNGNNEYCSSLHVLTDWSATTGRYWLGKGVIVNTNGTGLYLGRPVKVGSFPPNPWGLYDMYGNLSEWCRDWGGPYAVGPVTDPLGPATGTQRVYRGGSYEDFGSATTSAGRYAADPNLKNRHFGFRVVLAVPLP